MNAALPTYKDVVAAQARIKSRILQTPVLRSAVLEQIAGARLFIKAECLQETGSFKLRGATNRLLQIPKNRMQNGVVAFSSGNHAQGIARAARILGMPALIVMPNDAPEVKIDGVRSDGADVHLYDRNSESREEIAAQIAKQRGAVIVPSFDDPMIIAGQGTCGLEFAKQVAAERETLDHLICCTGGGGLISGIALALTKASPNTRIWTAEPDGHDDWKRSLEAGEIRSNAPGTRSECDAILTPLAIVEDTRCPADVQCFHGGELTVSTRIAATHWTQTAPLTLGDPYEVMGRTYVLATADPLPTAGGDIPAGDYRFVFERQ